MLFENLNKNLQEFYYRLNLISICLCITPERVLIRCIVVGGRVLKLAFLTTCHPEDESKLFLGLRIPGALALAVETVNMQRLLPNNYSLAFEVSHLYS